VRENVRVMRALVMTMVGAGIGLVVSVLQTGEVQQGPALIGVAIGGGLGALLGISLALSARRARRRLAAITDHIGHEDVIRVTFGEQWLAAETALAPWAEEGTGPRQNAYLSFDRSGIAMWSTTSDSAHRTALIPWSDVTDLRPAVVQVSGRPVQTLRLLLGEVRIDLHPFHTAGDRRAPLDEGDVAALIARTEIARGTRQKPGRVRTTFGVLEPGLSAWRADRLYRPVIAAILGFGTLALALGAIATGQFDTVVVAVGALIAVQIVYVMGTSMLVMRASARERAAGYTTLHRKHLELEQRHPSSGSVIRPAGEPPVEDTEFARLLEQ